ncbi:hypothetical protein A2661_02330 [Candidatus Giovannonibacteria bacterium RIFCSPHIGHO2_01_FULL_45_24]|uniref:Uncharacterized protein n=1 Tax=Candidatus Giovannonibacteria bacterium RIFCSPLOWO2_01_FULL_46_32 TaxID=1798353 RepID=A0A1F5XHY6_9BACT|nr:MAG: hypothetical protein A2661_02330 [Candidatus Giovannonibacteria bacterium RIFCSPHIGHO2_01_FULL_45_24]OGF87533.1 MAG: hypothetical protein A3B19_03055 [Candidatus Giovannonibacteria bacterium RIFCSPLOWO2_01_FULL_46_32]
MPNRNLKAEVEMERIPLTLGYLRFRVRKDAFECANCAQRRFAEQFVLNNGWALFDRSARGIAVNWAMYIKSFRCVNDESALSKILLAAGFLSSIKNGNFDVFWYGQRIAPVTRGFLELYFTRVKDAYAYGYARVPLGSLERWEVQQWRAG